MKTARALVEDTKTLVSGAADSQEQLAIAAQSAVGTITQLADVVKLGAATLGKSSSPPLLLPFSSPSPPPCLPFLTLCTFWLTNGENIGQPSHNHGGKAVN